MVHGRNALPFPEFPALCFSSPQAALELVECSRVVSGSPGRCAGSFQWEGGMPGRGEGDGMAAAVGSGEGLLLPWRPPRQRGLSRRPRVLRESAAQLGLEKPSGSEEVAKSSRGKSVIVI